MDPILLTINEAVRVSGISRTQLYQLAAAGRITFRKIGKRSLVPVADLRRLIEEMPAAAIRCGRKSAAR